jgi:hypothetical protein
VTTYTKVCKLFKHCGEVAIPIEDNLAVLKKTHATTEAGQLISPETLDGMPVYVVKIFIL